MAEKWEFNAVEARVGSLSRKGRWGDGLERPDNFLILLYHREELVFLSCAILEG